MQHKRKVAEAARQMYVIYSRVVVFCFVAVVVIAAAVNSATRLEPAILASGVYSSRFLRFELFSVSPPLVKVIAGLPIVVIPHSENWEGLDLSAGSRSEFRVGEDFVKANSDEFPWLLTLARWACLPFTIAGALFARAFAREVFDSEWAGFCGLLLWCIEPNILGHSALITNDVACSAFGLGATWLFWRWLKQPTWERAGIAGLVFGIAQLTKMSWLMLFGLWPVLWLLWLWCEPWQKQSQNPVSWRRQACQLAGMLALGLYIMNLGYAFDGTCTQLKKFNFVSSMLTGLDTPGEVGNRFRGSVLGELPVPLPEQYVLGFDLQKKDFEYWPRKSYLRGEWKQGGWWYYYLYGLWVKVPHGIQLLWLLAVVVPLWDWRQRHLGRPTLLGDSPCSGRDLLVLLAPGVCLFVLVSAQLEFNEHFRYVLPTIATLQVFAARLGRVFEPVGETAIQSQTTAAPA